MVQNQCTLAASPARGFRSPQLLAWGLLSPLSASPFCRDEDLGWGTLREGASGDNQGVEGRFEYRRAADSAEEADLEMGEASSRRKRRAGR